VQAHGVFAALAGGIPFAGAQSVPSSMLQLGLLLFGLALLRLDRKR